jgi:hypothetical protein
MAKRVFRFQADLRKPAPAPVKDQPSVNLQDSRWEQQFSTLRPARLAEHDYPDRLGAEELLLSYNATLQRLKSVPVGSSLENNVQLETYFDHQGCKSILSCHLEHRTRRISQVFMSQDGNLTRLSLEASGPEDFDLHYLLKRGLVDFEDYDLKAMPGYLWTAVDFLRESDLLVAVEQLRRVYDPAQDRIREWLDVKLDSFEG